MTRDASHRATIVKGLPIFGLFLLGSLAGCGAGGGDSTGTADSASTTGQVAQDLWWPHLCGGRADIQCKGDEVCFPLLSTACPGPGHAGICAPRPRACPPAKFPVCGCDGVTYDNLCEAAQGGSAIEHVGACDSSGPVCGDSGSATCPGSGTCVAGAVSSPLHPGAFGPRPSTKGNCECNVVEVCKQGFLWNDDPAVCACVVDNNPVPKDPCNQMTCKQGFVCVAHVDGTATCEAAPPTPKP